MVDVSTVDTASMLLLQLWLIGGRMRAHRTSALLSTLCVKRRHACLCRTWAGRETLDEEGDEVEDEVKGVDELDLELGLKSVPIPKVRLILP